MRKSPTRWSFIIAAVLFSLLTLPVLADQPPAEGQPTDTTKTEEPLAPPDSIREKTKKEVSKILEWLRRAEADTTAMTQAQPAPILPPVLAPLSGIDKHGFSFCDLAAYPHTAFSDHLLWQAELDAFATTEYATERAFSYRGLNPLPVRVLIDGVDIDLRRPTFPQTFSPDFMAVPPYMFSSFAYTPSRPGGLPGEVFSVRTFDSLVAQPYSDFFVRRGDYGLSLTQGRLFRPLPGRRTVNLGFSFARSDGRGPYAYDGGDNRYLHARIITPLRGSYNLATTYYQYRAKSDIPTAIDFWRYNFRRDDLSWHLDALVFRGDTTYSPWSVRFAYDNSKQNIRSIPNAHSVLLKKSRALLRVMYAPGKPDRIDGWRVGATIALSQLHVRAEHFRRPEYTLWVEQTRQPSRRHTIYASAIVDGNDHDGPGPQFVANWRFSPAEKLTMGIGLRRFRMIPSLTDREWLPHTAVFEDLENRIIHYSEVGNNKLAPWWSNSVTAEFGYHPGQQFSIRLSGWGSYEQDYYSWKDQADGNTTLAYQPSGTDARTVGLEIFAELPDIGPFSGRLKCGFRRAEEVSGKRLPDYSAHRCTGAVNADLTVRKLNLQLHGAAEFMYWRTPSADYTSYDRADVFRTDVLGSATIKDFTIYWLAQNLFNYGYCKAPGYNFLGRTIMWGLHLRFFN